MRLLGACQGVCTNGVRHALYTTQTMSPSRGSGVPHARAEEMKIAHDLQVSSFQPGVGVRKDPLVISRGLAELQFAILTP